MHAAIQKAVRFDDDHLYEFYAARTERSRPRFTIGGGSPLEINPGGPGSELMENIQFMPRDTFGPDISKHREAYEWALRITAIEEPALQEIFPLPERFKLFYWFDFGDDWKFEIQKARQAQPRKPRVKYPRVIERVGPDPAQYPEADEF